MRIRYNGPPVRAQSQVLKAPTEVPGCLCARTKSCAKDAQSVTEARELVKKDKETFGNEIARW